MKKEYQNKLTEDQILVLSTMEEKKFQNLLIQINDGKVVLIRREETIKPKQNGKAGSH